MSRFRMLRFAAISWLPLFSMVAGAQAQYNVASDWLSTYPTTTAIHNATTRRGATTPFGAPAR